jgi:putative pyruvate formate lyase activating enzyme
MSSPVYLELLETGELDRRIDSLYQILESCQLCPRKCHENRLRGQRGHCQAGARLMVSSYHPHFGEEAPLVGEGKGLVIAHAFGLNPSGGSGTIFLTNCNLLCVYCQNYDISHLAEGREVSEDEVASMMLILQGRGCHNINLVTPTHYAPQLVKAIKLAAEGGLHLPVVWNCGGYENVEVIKLLDGIIDIYMPDIKYGDAAPAKRYSNAPDYFDRCREAVREMHRQVGDLRLDYSGIAYRGLLIRHLVLPGGLAGTKKVLKFIANEISKDSYINIMGQYRPAGEAYNYPELNRYPSRQELVEAIDMAKELGLTRLDKE